ncbi:hypothetical protein D3C87_290610 [compost metagenome]
MSFRAKRSEVEKSQNFYAQQNIPKAIVHSPSFGVVAVSRGGYISPSRFQITLLRHPSLF